MEWEGREESKNVEDQRGLGGTAMVVGGGGAVAVIIGLVSWFLFQGADPAKLPDVLKGGGAQEGQVQSGGVVPETPQEKRMVKFTKVILGDTERVWGKLFKDKLGETYPEPHLVLFRGSVKSACGLADSAVGPFYCPGDSKIYIDLSFYKDMEEKLKAPGEFARAYVIAHEVGHHVQRLLGYSKKVDRARGTRLEKQMSVRLELQADYLAGVWAHWGQEEFKFLQKGDIESALKAAFEIGDDRLQKKARGTVVPDSFTHGTSKQRMRWFRRGFDTGSIEGAAALFKLDYDEL
jgi:uncharacterized protein